MSKAAGAHIERHDNGRYYVHWLEGRREKRVSTRTRDLEEATAFLREWLSLESEERRSRGVPTCGAAWTVYVAGHVDKKVVDKERLANAWKRLEPAFGHLRIDTINQAKLDAYVVARGHDGVSPATIRYELVALRQSWNFLVKTKKLSSDALPYGTLPEKTPPRDRWLTDDEIDSLTETATRRRRGKRLSRLERFVWLALDACARRRAIEKLEWTQIDFEAGDTGVIHFLPRGRNQTAKRRVSVSISDRLLPVLRRAYEERRSEFVLDYPGSIRKAFDSCAVAAKLERTTPHTLRHTAATHMARRKVPMWIVAGCLGDSIETVTRVYAKHAPDILREGVNNTGGSRLRVL